MPARLITHYRIARRLGAGGMGEVFLAQDTELERPVALKVMSAELAKDPNQRKRFRAEAKIASGLIHPHICTIYEVGETEDGRPFLAMEYLEGQTLDVLLQERRLRLGEVINLGIEVAEALAAAHERGLVHRDIKPGNIMLDRRCGAKVLDFGLAKWFAPDELSGAITSVALTRTGMLLGTPQYMSPEQALGRPLDPRSDIFSLGTVLYELVVGQRPFLGRTVGETINNVVNQPPAPLGLENPVFSPELDNILFKCLEKDPEKRYTSAQELAADLRKLKENSELALAATTQERILTSAIPASDERQPTALWKLAGKMSAGRKAALGWTIGFMVAALLPLAGWVLFRGCKPAPSAPPANVTLTAPQKSVAVLPFVNLGADKADEYLSDGISEEIITELSKIKGLKVPARTSCFAFKGRNEDIRRIGGQLGVRTVLEGSISKAGNKVRVTAQLINISDGFNVWSETYDRTLDDLLAIRTDVAARVAEALKGHLLGEERQQLEKPTTTSAEAYRLYLRGRYLWNRRSGENIKQAIGCFDQAIREDARYALAYAGLADCYDVLSYYTSLPPKETMPKARAAALKALELDGSLAEPHATLADIRAFFDWDWAGAEEEFRRAIALNPNYATAHHWFAIVLRSLRRHDEALAEIKLAQEIDPLSPIINAGLGLELFYQGKADLGIEILQREIGLDPSFVAARSYLGWVYLDTGKVSEAITEFETVRRLEGEGAFGLENLGCAYGRAGRTNEAQEILGRLLELQQQGLDQRHGIAMLQHSLGDNDAALNSLETAVEERARGLAALNFSPQWKDLRPHPRFQAILKRMNLAK